MTTEAARTHDEAQIRQLIANQARSIGVKEVDAIMAPYATDVIYSM